MIDLVFVVLFRPHLLYLQLYELPAPLPRLGAARRTMHDSLPSGIVCVAVTPTSAMATSPFRDLALQLSLAASLQPS